MKQTIFIFTAIVLLFSACRKKADKKNCYQCYRYDSVSATVGGHLDSILTVPNYLVDSQPHCGYTEDLKNLLVRKNTKIDTLYKSVKKGDTLELDHWTMRCEIY